MNIMSRPDSVKTEGEFELSGGAVCLDFVNTVGDRPRRENDKLAGYADLLGWAGQAGILDQSERRALERRAASRKDDARRAFHHAIELREVIYRTFSALAAGDRPGTGDLAALNAVLLETLPHLRLESDEGGYGWTWSGAASSLDSPLWPVVRSAADLLTSPEAKLVRECASETCSWMFVDRSRTRRRRWCDMKICGNRAKARRHYERTRKRPSTD